MSLSFFKRLALAAGLLLSASGAEAHPDISATARLLFDFEDGRLVRLVESLTFDEARSRILLRDHDVNDDGVFSAEEQEDMARQISADFGRYAFFLEMRSSGRLQVLGRPIAFTAKNEGGAVTIAIAFAMGEPLVVAEDRPVEVMIRDRDYTVAFRYAEDRPALTRGEGDLTCDHTLVERPGDAYFGGLIVPQAIRLSCR